MRRVVKGQALVSCLGSPEDETCMNSGGGAVQSDISVPCLPTASFSIPLFSPPFLNSNQEADCILSKLCCLTTRTKMVELQTLEQSFPLNRIQSHLTFRDQLKGAQVYHWDPISLAHISYPTAQIKANHQIPPRVLRRVRTVPLERPAIRFQKLKGPSR